MDLNFLYENNRFFAEDDDGKVIAEVTFPEKAPSVVELDHTFVDNSLRGQGVAGKLVRMVADFAFEHNLKIIPTCSYAVKWFDSHPEFSELISKN